MFASNQFWKIIGLTGVLVLYFAKSSLAVSSPIESGLHALDQTFYYQQNKKNQQQLQTDYNNLTPDLTSLAVPERLSSTNIMQGKSFTVATINIVGDRFLSQKVTDKITRSYSHKEIQLTDIQLLLNQLNNAAIRKGYVGSRFYVKEQSLNGGVFTIYAIEGKLSAIKGISWKQRAALFPGLKTHKHFNMRAVEKGLDFANALQTQRSKAQLIPDPDKFAHSILVLKQTKSPVPWGFSLSFDNHSNASIYPKSMSLFWEDFFSIYDKWTLSGAQEMDARNQYRQLRAQGKFSIARVQISIGSSVMENTTMTDGINRHYYLFSTQKSQEIGLSKRIFRSAMLDIGLFAKKKDKQVQTLLEDTVLNAQTYTKSVVDVGVKQTLRVPWVGSWVVIYTQSKEQPGKDTGQSLFLKHAAQVIGSKEWRFKRGVVRVSSTWTAQYSKDKLPSSEKGSAGGAYSVRGFDRSLYGEKTVVAQQSIRVPVTLLGAWAVKQPILERTRLVMVLDGGIVRSNGSYYQQTGRGAILGGGMGLSYRSGKVSVNYTVAKGLKSPEFMKAALQHYVSATVTL